MLCCLEPLTPSLVRTNQENSVVSDSFPGCSRAVRRVNCDSRAAVTFRVRPGVAVLFRHARVSAVVTDHAGTVRGVSRVWGCRRRSHRICAERLKNIAGSLIRRRCVRDSVGRLMQGQRGGLARGIVPFRDETVLRRLPNTRDGQVAASRPGRSAWPSYRGLGERSRKITQSAIRRPLVHLSSPR